MDDDIERRLQITTESIKTGHTSVVVAATGEEINMLRRQLAAAKLEIHGLDLRAAAHGNEIETLGAQAADVAGERAANAVLTAEIGRLHGQLEHAMAHNAAEADDAGRYRWLRDVSAGCTDMKQPFVCGEGDLCLSGEDVDAAVDAALKAVW